jgi:hypothetical protein
MLFTVSELLQSFSSPNSAWYAGCEYLVHSRLAAGGKQQVVPIGAGHPRRTNAAAASSPGDAHVSIASRSTLYSVVRFGFFCVFPCIRGSARRSSNGSSGHSRALFPSIQRVLAFPVRREAAGYIPVPAPAVSMLEHVISHCFVSSAVGKPASTPGGTAVISQLGPLGILRIMILPFCAPMVGKYHQRFRVRAEGGCSTQTSAHFDTLTPPTMTRASGYVLFRL